MFKEVNDIARTTLYCTQLKINNLVDNLLNQYKFEGSIVELAKLKIIVKYFKDLPINLVNNDIGDNYHNFRNKVMGAIINLVDDSINVLQTLIGDNLFSDLKKFDLLCNNIELISFTMNLRDLNEHFDVDELNKKFSYLKGVIEEYLRYLLDCVKSSCTEQAKQIYQENVDFSSIKQTIDLIKIFIKLSVVSSLKEKSNLEIFDYTFNAIKTVHKCVIACYNKFSDDEFLMGNKINVNSAKVQFSNAFYSLFKSRVLNDNCDFFSEIVSYMFEDVTKLLNIENLIADLNVNQHQQLLKYSLLNQKVTIFLHCLEHNDADFVTIVEELKKKLLDFKKTFDQTFKNCLKNSIGAINKVNSANEALMTYSKQFNEVFENCKNGIYFIDESSRIEKILNETNSESSDSVVGKVFNLKEKFIRNHFDLIITNLTRSYPWLDSNNIVSSIKIFNFDALDINSLVTTFNYFTVFPKHSLVDEIRITWMNKVIEIFRTFNSALSFTEVNLVHSYWKFSIEMSKLDEFLSGDYSFEDLSSKFKKLLRDLNNTIQVDITARNYEKVSKALKGFDVTNSATKNEYDSYILQLGTIIEKSKSNFINKARQFSLKKGNFEKLIKELVSLHYAENYFTNLNNFSNAWTEIAEEVSNMTETLDNDLKQITYRTMKLDWDDVAYAMHCLQDILRTHDCKTFLTSEIVSSTGGNVLVNYSNICESCKLDVTTKSLTISLHCQTCNQEESYEITYNQGTQKVLQTCKYERNNWFEN
jgi:hypothetical protein